MIVPACFSASTSICSTIGPRSLKEARSIWTGRSRSSTSSACSDCGQTPTAGRSRPRAVPFGGQPGQHRRRRPRDAGRPGACHTRAWRDQRCAARWRPRSRPAAVRGPTCPSPSMWLATTMPDPGSPAPAGPTSRAGYRPRPAVVTRATVCPTYLLSAGPALARRPRVPPQSYIGSWPAPSVARRSSDPRATPATRPATEHGPTAPEGERPGPDLRLTAGQGGSDEPTQPSRPGRTSRPVPRRAR